MAVKINTCVTESRQADEIYITAVPEGRESPQKQAEEIFGQIREILDSRRAYILRERIFTSKETAGVVLKERSRAYGNIDDGVEPSLLAGVSGGVIEGVQIQAIRSDYKAEIINFENQPCGRIVRMPDKSYLATSLLCDTESSDTAKQMETILKKAKMILENEGINIHSVPRKWMWLGDILSWYDEFNKIRNKFFREWGAIGNSGQLSIPASTGIGIGPVNGGKCAMELAAVFGSATHIDYLLSSKKQKSAFDYGSAFSRATISTTPAGKILFISGTASIDKNGATTNVGDAHAQIRTTVENIQAILKETKFEQKDVVQIMAYCKTGEVKNAFDVIKKEIDWPWLTVICDICRDDLLFEAEATAIKK